MDIANVRWGTWSDLTKVTVDGAEYAKIGGRRYTRHAVDRMAPTGFGTAVGGIAGRGVPTIVLEAAIKSGEKVASEVVNGVVRETWKMGRLSGGPRPSRRTLSTQLRMFER
jgi:hypothetical protein